MQPSEVCRICGGTGLFLNIFDKETKYFEDVEGCLSVKVKQDDGRSQVICHKCLGTLAWCKSYVNKVDLVKKNNPAPSPKLCYSCRSSKGHLFPFPEKSVDKFQELFGLSLLNPKNLKICHECQFSLDCVNDLKEKANTSHKLSGRGKHLQFEVSQKNASVDDLVSSLKNREVEIDGDANKSSRKPKSPVTGNKKRENGTSTADSDEEDTAGSKSSPRKKVKAASDAKKPGRNGKSSAKENSCSENDSPKENKSKRRRRSHSSESELNTSTDSTAASISKKSNDSLLESRKSSRESSNPKTKETDKCKPSPKSKRQRVDKIQEAASDSDSDSVCLASLSDSNKRGKQAEPPAKFPRGKSKTLVKKLVEKDNSTSRKGSGKKAEKCGEESKDDGKRGEKSRSESKTSKKVTFGESKKEAGTAAKTRKKRTIDREASSDEEEVNETKRKKQVPLQEYTCAVCSEDFDSTVVGKRHELSHDSRFDKCEVKLVRVSASEIAAASDKPLKKASVNSEDDEDDLWASNLASKGSKTDSKPKDDDFDALFGGEAEKSSNVISSSVKDSDSVGKTEEQLVFNNSDSEEKEESEPVAKVGKPDEKSEETLLKLDENSEGKNPEQVSEEKGDPKDKEQKLESDNSDLDKSDLGRCDSQDAELRKEEDKKAEGEEEEQVEGKTCDESEGKDDSATVTSSQDAKSVSPSGEESVESESPTSKRTENLEDPESEKQDPDSSIKEAETSNNIPTENSDLNSSKSQD